MAENLPLATFYGPDAVGKTTLAHLLAHEIEACGLNVAIIGSSEYEKWLTDKACRNYLGYALPDTASLDTSEKEVFYEDLAIAGYLHGEQLRKQGRAVLIDSDPYLKRLIWARHHIGEDSNFLMYADRFEEKVRHAIGPLLFPDTIIRVETGEECTQRAAEVTLMRIAVRKTNSEYDPQGIEANIAMHRACESVWDMIIETMRYQRMESVATLNIANFDREGSGRHRLHRFLVMGLMRAVIGEVQ